MANGDKMVLGRDNFATDGTRLVETSRGENDFMFKVDADREVTIHGASGRGEAVRGSSGNIGVRGIGEAAGVVGEGDVYGVKGLLSGASIPDNRIEHAGVVGSAADSFGVGVMGIGSVGMPGMLGSCQTDPGVQGLSTSGAGVYGQSFENIGVRGEGGSTGVLAFSRNGTGVSARGLEFAGFFFGSVMVFRGDFTVIGGAKSAAVPHPDGYHRRLYSVESPESWFEDFGEGKLVKGHAKIKLDPDFASIVRTKTYHVFLTAYGDTNGLYVSKRTAKAFEVREHQKGKSSVPFSYRIVAKRKDIEGKRLAKVSLPPVPRELKAPKTARSRD
jgi:hypothetical protein